MRCASCIASAWVRGSTAKACAPLVTHQRRWQDGCTLQRAPLNPLCEQLYGAPHLTLHRRDLLAVIASGLPSERIHLSHRLVGFTNQGDVVEARFDNGARISFDVLVGADGIRSTVRTALFGDEASVFAGCVAYRGLVPIERIADLSLEQDNQSWVGPGGHFFGVGHTLARFETAFYSPLLSDWRNFETWEETGALDGTRRANSIWKELLRTYVEPPMDPAVREELSAFVARRKQEIVAG